jgi:hypothetical protein
MEGLDYFYTAKNNLKDVYNTRKQFSALVNGWERWEPDDKAKKNLLRMRWRNPDEKNSRKNVKVTTIRDGGRTRKMDTVRISSLWTWIVIMTLTRTLQREYATKPLGTAYWRRRPNTSSHGVRAYTRILSKYLSVRACICPHGITVGSANICIFLKFN